MESNVKAQLEKLQSEIENRLGGLVSVTPGEKHVKTVLEAMKYSLEAGGKRIRPVLLIEFCRLLGGNTEEAVDSACAVEMLHTFSLIHDDLPCMDNDDLRRGKPSCHVAYGEAAALLAGDALAILPFQVISADKKLSPDKKAALVYELSYASGSDGMIGGQIIDLEQGEDIKSEDVLLEMYRMKTGALLRAACRMGAVIGGATSEQLEKITAYSEKLGLAFQIIDDILDITSSSEELGKPVGSDKEQGKSTYPELLGLEEARKTAKRLTEEALLILEDFEGSGFLSELTKSLLARKY